MDQRKAKMEVRLLLRYLDAMSMGSDSGVVFSKGSVTITKLSNGYLLSDSDNIMKIIKKESRIEVDGNVNIQKLLSMIK